MLNLPSRLTSSLVLVTWDDHSDDSDPSTAQLQVTAGALALGCLIAIDSCPGVCCRHVIG